MALCSCNGCFSSGRADLQEGLLCNMQLCLRDVEGTLYVLMDALLARRHASHRQACRLRQVQTRAVACRRAAFALSVHASLAILSTNHGPCVACRDR